MSVLGTRTKKVLAGLAVVAFLWEVAAVFGHAELITEAMAELGCERPWIPYWLASLLVHLFFPRRSVTSAGVAVNNVGAFLWLSFVMTGAWEVGLASGLVAGLVPWFCAHMWVPALAGGVAGHFGFPRAPVEGEI